MGEVDIKTMWVINLQSMYSKLTYLSVAIIAFIHLSGHKELYI